MPGLVPGLGVFPLRWVLLVGLLLGLVLCALQHQLVLVALAQLVLVALAQLVLVAPLVLARLLVAPPVLARLALVAPLARLALVAPLVPAQLAQLVYWWSLQVQAALNPVQHPSEEPPPKHWQTPSRIVE